MLAALACVLVRNGKKVAYLPDCRALVKAPLHRLQFALKFAFHSQPDIQGLIQQTKNLDDVYQLCRAIAGQHIIYFLIDQCNALDFMDSSTDRIAETSKGAVRTVLDSITQHHFKISSATANYQHGAGDRLRVTSERILSVNSGLDEVITIPWYQRPRTLLILLVC